MMARMGHARAALLRAWLTTSACTPLFCVVKTSEMLVAAWISAAGTVRTLSSRQPMYCLTLASHKGEPSVEVPVYSPGRRRKKNANTIM